MKEGFRQSMAWLHTWVGLVVGWVLFFVFVTGTLGYFDDEIDRWMRPELPLAELVELADREAVIARSLARLEQAAPAAQSWGIQLPHVATDPRGVRGLGVSWVALPAADGEPKPVFARRGSERLDADSGEPVAEVKARETRGGFGLYRMHYVLHYLPVQAGLLLVGLCTMLMFMALITGVITHKQIFKDFFTFRPGKGQRSWLDAHNVVSVMALPFFVMITYSGLVFLPAQYMPAAIHTVYGSEPDEVSEFFDEFFWQEDSLPVAVQRPAVPLMPLLEQAERQWGAGSVAGINLRHAPDEVPEIEIMRVSDGWGDNRMAERLRFDARDGSPRDPPVFRQGVGAVHQTVLALHEGLFAGPVLRWLYFGSGLLGCAMIGTGLVLWTVKRRKRHDRNEVEGLSLGATGLRLVEVLNVGTLAGLPVAVAAYFWANRLLPVDMASRAAWETHVLFAVWGWLFVYASLRPLRKAWCEILWLGAAAYALLPVLNALTTERHLGVTIPHGDWALAGVDLTVLACALVMAWMAMKLQRRWQSQPEVAA